VVAEHATARFAALGTTALVAVDRPDYIDLAESVLRDELERIDRACSRFRDDSELSALNRAQGREVAVGMLLWEALSVALRAAAITDGDVDPTVGRAMGEMGYDRDFTLVRGPRPGVVVTITPVPGWRAVRLDRERGTVTVPAGVSIDLGATAKALAADRAARAVHDATGAGTVVSLGGDIALCGPAPEGHARWTLKLLAQRMVELEIVDSIGPECVRTTLKKTCFSRGAKSNGCCRPSKTPILSVRWKTCSKSTSGPTIRSGRSCVLTSKAGN